MVSEITRSLRHFIPGWAKQIKKQREWKGIRREFASLSVADAFSETYRRQLWGKADGEEFCSGDGSSERFSALYVDLVSRFVRERNISCIVDLGCGDFRVGRLLCAATGISYIGVDVVPDLIAYNSSRFGRNGIEFRCASIVQDELPPGGLCLIRQVLQHLSNAEILRVLDQCSKYPYLMVTEDVYAAPRVRPNLDHVHGPDNRLHKRSGVFLDLPPFELKAQKVLEIPCPETSSVISTVLIAGSAERVASAGCRAALNSRIPTVKAALLHGNRG
jgi:SAM-dependent methyltransferase